MYRQAVVVFAFQDNFQIIQGLVSFSAWLKKICQKNNYLLNAHSEQFALFSEAFVNSFQAWQSLWQITSYILAEKNLYDLSVESALRIGEGGRPGASLLIYQVMQDMQEEQEQEQAGEPRWLLANATPAGNQATDPSQMKNLTISFLPNATQSTLDGTSGESDNLQQPTNL